MSQYAQIAWDEYHSFKDYVGITCNICNNTPETEEWVVNRSDPVRIYGHKQKKKKLFSASESENLMSLMIIGDQNLFNSSTKDKSKAIHRLHSVVIIHIKRGYIEYCVQFWGPHKKTLSCWSESREGWQSWQRV